MKVVKLFTHINDNILQSASSYAVADFHLGPGYYTDQSLLLVDRVRGGEGGQRQRPRSSAAAFAECRRAVRYVRFYVTLPTVQRQHTRSTAASIRCPRGSTPSVVQSVACRRLERRYRRSESNIDRSKFAAT